MKIDNHVHVFNLNYIPVAGVVRLYSEVRMGQGRMIPVWICNAVAKYYLRKTEDPERIGKTAGFQPVSYDTALSLIFNPDTIKNLEIEQSGIDEDLSQFIISEEGETTLNEFLTPAEIKEMGYHENTKVKEVINNSNKKNISIQSIWTFVLIILIRILSKAIYKKFFEPHFTWFDFMTKPYEEIASEMISHFKEIDLFIHLDMDMADWYPLANPVYNYETHQVPRISELTKKSNGKIAPFYAYNPQKTLESLKDAIAKKGYIGVKFYPPSGYFPIGNTEHPEWDARNIELFDYCINPAVPILSHCNTLGMQAGYQNPKRGNPVYWEKVLNLVDATGNKPYHKLTLCLGHAGGDEEWFYDNTPEGDSNFFAGYPGKVYEMCTEYENVYCDLSYMHEVHDPDQLKKLHTRLLSLFEKSKTENRKFLFEDKIIYGSDWHMIMQEHDSGVYLPSFLNLFKDSNQYEEKFFHTNAVKFLNIKSYIERGKNEFLSVSGIENLNLLLK